ncbi:MAG: zinc ABC transporter substrate-binding protein [Candidatus Izemoplasma sp.]|nr:zinc ABC transporter substrate-binding protein [Candidatus Izemoplasma sp.]
MKKLILILSIVLVGLLSACGNNGTDDSNVVYVTVYPMQYLVEQIAGDTIEVKRVPGSNTHSESIDWGAQEIISMLDADLLFYINGGVDTYIPNNADTTFADGNVELVDMSSHIEYNEVCYTDAHDHSYEAPTEEHTGDEHTEETIDCEENQLAEDPHFWLDPVRMLEAATFIKDKLIATFPENGALYDNNFTVLNASLEKLDQDYQTMADEATKPIITTTMLFTYWNERYDIEILPITTSAHSTENVPGDIIHFVEEAEYHSIQYILFEMNANSPAGDQVLSQLQEVNETASKLYLHGLGNLTTEELEQGKTYLTIMYENLDTLKIATK